MKHIPERHQSVAPSPSFLFTIGAIVFLMAVIFTVVALAER